MTSSWPLLLPKMTNNFSKEWYVDFETVSIVSLTLNDNDIYQDLNSQFCLRYSGKLIFPSRWKLCFLIRFVRGNEVFLQFICFALLLLFFGVDMTTIMLMMGVTHFLSPFCC